MKKNTKELENRKSTAHFKESRKELSNYIREFCEEQIAKTEEPEDLIDYFGEEI